MWPFLWGFYVNLYLTHHSFFKLSLLEQALHHHPPSWTLENNSPLIQRGKFTICFNNAQSHNWFQRLIFSFFVFFVSLSLYLRSHTYTHFFCLHLCAEIEIHQKWLQSSSSSSMHSLELFSALIVPFKNIRIV